LQPSHWIGLVERQADDHHRHAITDVVATARIAHVDRYHHPEVEILRVETAAVQESA
jgi:hypothetical protein